METRSWATIDKSSWGDGPWQEEQDKYQWPDEATGLACLIKRSEMSGALCGYVGVPEGHPWHGVPYQDIEPQPDAPGGLTYSSLCQEGPEGHTVCHVPDPGEPEPLYWLGFDCAHSWDVSPAMDAYFAELGVALRQPLPLLPVERWATYKSVEYVKARVTELAAAVAKAATSEESGVVS